MILQILVKARLQRKKIAVLSSVMSMTSPLNGSRGLCREFPLELLETTINEKILNKR